MPTRCNRKKMDSRGTKRHGRKGHGRKHGGGFMGAAAFDSAAYGTASQQMDYIARQGTGPANAMSAYLPVNPPPCMHGGKKHRKKTHKKRSSNKKSAKKHRKGKKRGGYNLNQTVEDDGYRGSESGEAKLVVLGGKAIASAR